MARGHVGECVEPSRVCFHWFGTDGLSDGLCDLLRDNLRDGLCDGLRDGLRDDLRYAWTV